MAMAEAVTSPARPPETRAERPSRRRIRSSIIRRPISMSWRTNWFRVRTPGAESMPESARKSIGLSFRWNRIRMSMM
jgi:hypothetical protein